VLEDLWGFFDDGGVCVGVVGFFLLRVMFAVRGGCGGDLGVVVVCCVWVMWVVVSVLWVCWCGYRGGVPGVGVGGGCLGGLCCVVGCVGDFVVGVWCELSGWWLGVCEFVGGLSLLVLLGIIVF